MADPLGDVIGYVLVLTLALVFGILVIGSVYAVFIIIVSFKKNKLLGASLLLALIFCLFLAFNGNIGPFIVFIILLGVYGLVLLIKLIYSKLKKK